MKKTFLKISLVFLSILFCLICMEIGIRVFRRHIWIEEFNGSIAFNKKIKAKIASLVKEGFDKREDYDLGWDITNRIRKDGSVPGLIYHSNAQSIRGTKDYPVTPSPKITRIAAFGDSFIYGQCVSEEDSWASVLEEKYLGQVEVLNFGVNGYGTDQAFLKYKKKGAKFKPDIVIIGLQLENTFRNVNVFRYLYMTHSPPVVTPKPRFVLENGKLRLIKPMPVKNLYDVLSDFDNSEFKKYEYFYIKTFLDYYPFNLSTLGQFISFRYKRWKWGPEYGLSKGAEPFETTLAIVSEFYNDAIKNNAEPFVLIIPISSTFVECSADLQEAFDERGIRYLNAGNGFLKHMDKHKTDWLYYLAPNCKHFTKLGNQILAAEIYDYLNANKNIYFRKTLK